MMEGWSMGDSEDTCFLGLSFGVSPVGKAGVKNLGEAEGCSPTVPPLILLGDARCPACPRRRAVVPSSRLTPLPGARQQCRGRHKWWGPDFVPVRPCLPLDRSCCADPD